MIQKERTTFPSGKILYTGYLYYGDSQATDQPCIIMAQGFSGTQDTPSFQTNAMRFAEAGFTVFSFDYRNFGESSGSPRQMINIREQLQDIRAAIGFVGQQPNIDTGKIILWGTSLGGGHVVTVASEEPSIAAVIAQVPFNGFPKKAIGRSRYTTIKLLAAMVLDSLKGRLHLSPHYIKAVGKPDEPVVMGMDNDRALIKSLQSSTWQNKIAPRVLFQMMNYKPSNYAHNLQMPLLVCIASQDEAAPPETAHELAKAAMDGTTKEYPVSHYEIYKKEVMEQVVKDQIAFLKERI